MIAALGATGPSCHTILLRDVLGFGLRPPGMEDDTLPMIDPLTLYQQPGWISWWVLVSTLACCSARTS